MIIAILIFSIGCIQAAPLFDFLPPVIIDNDQQIINDNNAHTTIFFPVGKYATDVHYQIIRIPIHLQPIEAVLKRAGEVLIYMRNLIRGKATEIPITQIIGHHNESLHRVNTSYKNMIANLPSAQFTAYGSRKKQFLDLLFGIVGTALGVSNTIEIAKINSIIVKNIHRTDMLVDVSQLHENHFYKLDNMIKNTAETLSEFVKYSAAAASSYLDNMIATMQYVQKTIEDGLEQAQNQKLSYTLFPNDVLQRIKQKIDQMAQENGFFHISQK